MIEDASDTAVWVTPPDVPVWRDGDHQDERAGSLLFGWGEQQAGDFLLVPKLHVCAGESAAVFSTQDFSNRV